MTDEDHQALIDLAREIPNAIEATKFIRDQGRMSLIEAHDFYRAKVERQTRLGR